MFVPVDWRWKDATDTTAAKFRLQILTEKVCYIKQDTTQHASRGSLEFSAGIRLLAWIRVEGFKPSWFAWDWGVSQYMGLSVLNQESSRQSEAVGHPNWGVYFAFLCPYLPPDHCGNSGHVSTCSRTSENNPTPSCLLWTWLRLRVSFPAASFSRHRLQAIWGLHLNYKMGLRIIIFRTAIYYTVGFRC